MNEIKNVVWPVRIDHIEVRDTTYVKGEQEVQGKTYLFFVNPAMPFGFDRASVMTRFSSDGVAQMFKDLKTEEIDGATTITAATILNALAPGESEKKPYKGPDGCEYESYGEYLLYLGTKSAFEPKLMSSGVVFGERPLSDGKEQFIRCKDGKPQKRHKTGQTIVAATTQVAAMMMFTPNGWFGKNGSDEACLQAEVSQQLTAGLWKKIEPSIINPAPTPEPEKEETEAAGED